jgi:hypothetical protein
VVPMDKNHWWLSIAPSSAAAATLCRDVDVVAVGASGRADTARMGTESVGTLKNKKKKIVS